jgi:hypothetical protein
MYNKLITAVCGLLLMLVLLPTDVFGQCFASGGNPMGGSGNMGVMNKRALRTLVFYRYHYGSTYFEGDKVYEGSARLYQNADYHYTGLLLAYGLTDRLTVEFEGGYYPSKTVRYRIADLTQRGFGLSNGVTSLKYAFRQNHEKRFELSGAAGVAVPFRSEFQRDGGVVLPDDVQPSNASLGLVAQTYLIKENSFTSMRFFWVNRYEHYFANPRGDVFGAALNSAVFVSRHFVFGQGGFKDWTAIVQVRYQYKGQTVQRETGNITQASGGQSVVVVPQINCSIHETWNISLLIEKPVYQYYNGIQIGADYALLLTVARDFNLKKKQPKHENE